MRVSSVVRQAIPALIGTGLLVGLYGVARYNYLLFHSLVELFSIAVAVAIFMLAWNARRFMRNDYLLFLGIAYLFIACIDLVHTLAYKGMGVFEGYDADLPTQLWIVGRGIEALSLLVAPVFLARRLKPTIVLVIYAVTSAALLGSVFRPTGTVAFPACFAEGVGLTHFKKISEYVICGILLLSLVLLLMSRRALLPGMLRLMSASILATVGSELAFTLYVDLFGFSNLIGHLLKLISFYMIYRAIIETGLTRPYRTLFRELTASEQALRDAGEQLEQRVQERTAQVRELALALTHIEHQERRRLTQILHDGVQPLLVAAKMHIGTVRNRFTNPADRQPLDQAHALLGESLEASRSVAMELSPPILHDGGLLPALDWLAHRMQTQHGLAVAVDAAADTEPAADNVRILLFEATRELLLNVVKHARADSATVRLHRTEGAVETIVADAGRGFSTDDDDREQTEPTGAGLLHIRHRLELVGGRMQIDSATGGGTQVRLTVPDGG